MTVDDGMIPYMTNDTFTGVVGQEAYPISDLISIDTLVFYLEDVRYNMIELTRDQYFGTGRTENINSLPYNFHLERNFGGATIYVYFRPDQAYEFEYWGKSRLSSVTINQDLELTLDRFYINFLRYILAERLCQEFDFTVPAGVAEQVKRYRRYINKKSAPMDMSMRKLSILQDGMGLNYAAVNLGRGWTPS